MMDATLDNQPKRWVFNLWHLFLVLAALAVLVFICYEGLNVMVSSWSADEYSHSYLLPFISLFFAWQKRSELLATEPRPIWSGLLVVTLGLLVYLMGELGTLYALIQYSFLVILAGFMISLLGWKGFRILLVPYTILFFMVPLPVFLYNNLSAQLQLISSQIGVEVIRLFGISVFLEGNVIDLGEYKLQVVEACSGLRYLFPLTALGFISAYIFKGAFWKKAVLFLSTIPITVLMNSFRIGVIGVLVEYWGQSMAEGFLHDFEGWFVFMACAAVLVVEMWILTKIGKDKMPLREAFALEMPAPLPKDSEVRYRKLGAPFYAAFILLVGMAIVSQVLPDRKEFIPQRTAFKVFPEQVGDWKGSMDRLESIYIDSLKLDDHLLAKYRNGEGKTVNFYVAYYGSQRKGASAHSPKTCLPGGGWQMSQVGQRVVDGVMVNGHPLEVNRSVIQLGDAKQLVYYWFQQRGRVITNEYLVKWYLFWDALTKNRTDGALVRLTAMVSPGQDVEEVDRVLKDFTRDVSGELVRFVPN
jgi:exosortase D (VPLPA-CTERM-specific)